MKKRLGKITIGLALILVLILSITWMLVDEAKAAKVSSQTFVLPSNSSVTHSANTYIILWDVATGNLVDDNGVIAAGNTWTGGDIATAVHAQNGTVYTATIPALTISDTGMNTTQEYAMAIYDNASPAKTDVPTMGPFLYDPLTNKVYSDTNPIRKNKVSVIVGH